MPLADLILDGQHRWGADQDHNVANATPRIYFTKKEQSFTTATGSVTLGETSVSLDSPRRIEEETRVVREKESTGVYCQATTSADDSLQPKVGNSSMHVPTIHRASTLGGTRQRIVLDPHLIALERLGPKSLEAKGIEIATRPSSSHFYPLTSTHVEISAMIPRVIHIRSPLRSILKQPDSTYKPPASYKRVGFKPIPQRSSDATGGSDDSKRMSLLKEEDVQMLWWTKDELKELEIREWFAARNFVRSSPRFAEAFERILIECFKSIEKDPKLSKEQLGPDGGLGLTNDEALKMMTSHDLRGLERSMVHWLSVGAAKHYFNIKKNCTIALLKAQSRWRNVDETAEVKAQKIGASIRNYSLFSERLAQLLAQGDAEALDEYDVDEDSWCPIERSEMLRPSIPRGRIAV